MNHPTLLRAAVGVALSIVLPNIYAHGGDSSLIHACVDTQNVIKLSGPNLACVVDEVPLHWSIEGPPGPTDPVLLGRIDTLEAQVATLQSQVAGLVSPALPDVVMSNVTLNEGSSNDSFFVFTVSLSMPSSDTVVINYSTADGTADATDYLFTSGQLVFLPGDASKTVSVTVFQDIDVELDETFTLELISVTNANGGNVFATGTIVNDDFPSASIAAVDGIQEGDLYTYSVDLSEPAAQEVTIDYTTIDGAATLADNDYTETFGTLSFSPGQTSALISVQTNADANPEGIENFSVSLSNPVNAVLSVSQVSSSLVDSNLTVSILDASVVEGNTGTSPVTNMAMTIELAQAVNGEVSVRYGQAIGGTATTFSLFNSGGDVRVIPFSSCHADNAPATCPTITFAPGETTKTIYIQVNGDTVSEPDDNFFVKIFEPAGAIIDVDTAEGIIINDD